MFLADNVDLSADKIDADPLILPDDDVGEGGGGCMMTCVPSIATHSSSTERPHSSPMKLCRSSGTFTNDKTCVAGATVLVGAS